MNDAIRNAAGADLKGATTVLDPEARHVTIINTYVVEPERADELIEFLVEATRSTIRHVPGFLSANLHVAIDRIHVVNYAQWQSREAIAAAR
jgi:quinol monooxygenase YgiN